MSSSASTAPPPPAEAVAVLGDLHGHLQLALCMLARWQREANLRFTEVLLCGDVGTFTDPAQLDNATHKHARSNPCELEFLQQWAVHPTPAWIERIFQPEPDGLGLCCPVIMVHGNHEGFAHLASLYPKRRPAGPVEINALPPVDAGGHVQLLPPGWIVRTSSGRLVAGCGGMEAGQRRAKYHPMAYIDDDAVEWLTDGPRVDILITHQGPAAVQGDHGSPTLDVLTDSTLAPRYWFHGHSTPVRELQQLGRRPTTVVPLGDIAFPGRGPAADQPGLEGWSYLQFNSNNSTTLVREPTPFWREFRRKHWTPMPNGQLVCPPLASFVE